jgi:hypothetical protein
MSRDHVHLPPNSLFSKEVFKEIRPHIPRHYWPDEFARGKFVPDPTGYWLRASFEGFPHVAAEQARVLVEKAGVKLVMASPAGYAAVAVFRMQRWRDTTLFALLPVLFAIPLLSGVAEGMLRWTVAVFAIDAIALAVSHVSLLRGRAQLAASHFSADIPAPGLRLRAAIQHSLGEVS